jgi:hypothetical protein
MRDVFVLPYMAKLCLQGFDQTRTHKDNKAWNRSGLSGIVMRRSTTLRRVIAKIGEILLMDLQKRSLLDC